MLIFSCTAIPRPAGRTDSQRYVAGDPPHGSLAAGWPALPRGPPAVSIAGPPHGSLAAGWGEGEIECRARRPVCGWSNRPERLACEGDRGPRTPSRLRHDIPPEFCHFVGGTGGRARRPACGRPACGRCSARLRGGGGRGPRGVEVPRRTVLPVGNGPDRHSVAGRGGGRGGSHRLFQHLVLPQCLPLQPGLLSDGPPAAYRAQPDAPCRWYAEQGLKTLAEGRIPRAARRPLPPCFFLASL